MNDHLKPIFEIILPAIENSGIPYWVFGGVAIAGIKGVFIRNNKDVDIFVLEKNYKEVVGILGFWATQLNWKIKDSEYKGRPKRELYPMGREDDIFSVVPVYEVNNEVKFQFPGWRDRTFPNNSLSSQKVSIEQYQFFTPDREIIKGLFKHYLRYLIKRNDDKSKLKLENYKRDAQVILCPSEQEEFFGMKLDQY